jgi:prepilin-type N-terminal cleavage/methylation domain-containing protein
MRLKTQPSSFPLHGFTLVEMAVVMMILGLMLGGLFTAIGQSTENKRRTDTISQLALVEEAL